MPPCPLSSSPPRRSHLYLSECTRDVEPHWKVAFSAQQHPSGSPGSSPLTCAGLPSPATSARSCQGQEQDTQRQQDRPEGSGSQAPSRARTWPKGRQLLLRHLGQPFGGRPRQSLGWPHAQGLGQGQRWPWRQPASNSSAGGSRWCWQVGAAAACLSISSFPHGLGSCRAGDS